MMKFLQLFQLAFYLINIIMNNEFIKHPLDLSFVIIIGCAGVMVSISE